MPTLVWIRRPESGVAAARGEYGAGSRSGEAAVPDPVVSAASAVPGPDVSSSDVALPAVSSRQHGNGGKEKKREINHGNAAAAANKRVNASPDRDHPAGVNQLPSGKFHSRRIYWGGKLHNIGTFKSPEQASAAYTFLRRELDHAKLSAAGAEVDIALDIAKRKALESVGVFIRDLPLGIYKTSSGKFKSMIRRGGKTHYIGIFDTPEQASAAYISVKKDLDDAKLSAAGAEVDALFDAAQKKALESVGRLVTRDLPTGVYKARSGKFESKIRCRGKTYYIGTFDTPDEASAAYASAKKDLSGAKLSTFTADRVDDAFEAAQTKASVSLGRFVPAKQDVSAAVPANQDVTAAVPAVSSVAFPAVSSKRYMYAGGGKKTKKRKMNRAKAATPANKKFKAAPDQELPQGVCKVKSGKFQSQIGWGYTQRYIGTFEAPEQASAAYMYMSAKKDLDAAKLWALNADEVTAAFDAAKAKALESVGGVAQKKKKGSEQHLPKGVWKVKKTGKFQTKIRWGGKQRYIGTFDSLEQASTAYLSVRKDLEDTKQSGFSADEADVAFDSAKKKALGRVVPKRKESSLAFWAAKGKMHMGDCDEYLV